MSKKTAMIVLSSIIAVCIAACVIIFFISKAVYTPKDDTVCIDGCDIPRYDEDGNEVFAVVSPVGYCNVRMIEQAPRLDTLADKTIALVGGSFMASTTHFEIKRCIEEEYQNVTIYMFNQVGAAGNFAVPTNKSESSETNTQVQRFRKNLWIWELTRS